MLLTEGQAHELLAKHGVFSREAYDRCGTLLGAVRYTRRGEPGEWCSALCQDGMVEQQRRGGRPRKYRNAGERQVANVEYQRRFRLRSRRKKTTLQRIDFMRLTKSIFGSYVVRVKQALLLRKVREKAS